MQKYIIFLKKHWLVIVVASILLLGLFLRLIALRFPDWQVFDEIYYYNFAHDYIRGYTFFDVHPPLGKLFISFGLLIFQNKLFGARIFEALAGIAVLYLMFRFSYLLFKNKTTAILVLLLTFLETSLYVESRFALLNIFIIVFTLSSAVMFWKWRESKNCTYLYLSLLFVSLATSVKWTGIANLIIYAIFFVFDDISRHMLFSEWKKQKWWFLVVSLIFLVVPYLLIFEIDILRGTNFLVWHKQAFDFHKNLVSHHPYASRWYKWFLDIRPLWLEFRQTPEGNVVAVIQVGNPIILWLGTISIIYNFIYLLINKNKALLFIILAIAVNTIPWIIIKRESFYYHFIPILPFVILSLGYFMQMLIKKYRLTAIVVICIILATGFFIWFWPMINGIPMPFASYNDRIIFPSWR
jgi:dolichyl-phosphate-mannose-protein mannosyltransferase